MYTTRCQDHDRCPLDLARLRVAIAEVSTLLRAMKVERRQASREKKKLSLLPPLGPHKERATLLCSLRAAHRGRLHLTSLTLEEQAEKVEALAAAFTRS